MNEARYIYECRRCHVVDLCEPEGKPTGQRLVTVYMVCKDCEERMAICLYHKGRIDAPCICYGEDYDTEGSFKARLPEYAHTWDWEEHPENYDDICMCALCRSYADS